MDGAKLRTSYCQQQLNNDVKIIRPYSVVTVLSDEVGHRVFFFFSMLLQVQRADRAS